MSDDAKEHGATGNADIQVLSNYVDDLFKKYVEISRGIVQITAKLEVLQDFKGERKDQLAQEINQLSQLVVALQNKTSTMPSLHRDIISSKTDVANVRRTLESIQSILSERGSESRLLEERHNALDQLIQELNASNTKLHNTVCTYHEDTIECRTRTTNFIDDTKKWRDEEVAPAILRINRLWWGSIAVYGLLGIISLILGIIVAVQKLSEPKAQPKPTPAVQQSSPSSKPSK